MAKSPKKKSPALEIVPNAWPRFERFIKEVAKAGPRPRQAPKNVTPKPGKEKSQKRDG